MTEYRFQSSNDAGNYNLEVEYMSSDDVQEPLEELLLNYRAFYTNIYREVQNNAERNLIKSLGEKAESTFQCLFRNHLELTQEFLADETPGAEYSILAHLVSKAGEVLQQRPGGLTASTWSTSAETVDELIEKLEPIVRDDADEDQPPPLWPFVRIIRFAHYLISIDIRVVLTHCRIYLRSYILRTGLVLADLPGKD